MRGYLKHSGFDLIHSDYSDRIYDLRPVGWLRFYLRRLIGRRPLKWKEIPPNRQEFLAQRKLPDTLSSNLLYLAAHPLDALDRVLLPLFEKYEKRSKKYGVVTFCAVKR